MTVPHRHRRLLTAALTACTALVLAGATSAAPRAAAVEMRAAARPAAFPIERVGAQSADVAAVQLLLGAHGRSVAVDGRFGTGTLRAVRDLVVDGGVDGLTRRALLVTLDTATVVPRRLPPHQAVLAAKLLLGGRAPSSPTGLPEFVRNAVPTYDLNAIASVRAFQRSNGPAVDGVVEPLTWRSLVAEPAPGAVSASLLPAAPSETQSASLTVPVVIGEVATGLNVPWGLAFLPGGGALAAERNTGRIVRIAVNGQKTRVGIVPGVVAREEGGLLGLAPSPGFARDRLLYAYFTAAGDNRIVRMRYGSDGRLGPATVVLAGIPKADFHNGGRLVFGPDGTLYASTGDATAGPHAQDLTSLGGKILRMTGNGRPAPGNPFKNSLVWSYGHRNIEGLAFDARGQLWASEFGQDAWDELNLIRKGGNYGWPLVEGRGGDKRFTDPVAVWRPAVASPSGIAVAAGAVWMASLRGTRLWRIPLTATGVGTPTAYLTGRYGRLRTVAAAPGGGLWLITSNTDGRGAPRRGDDRILRLALRPS